MSTEDHASPEVTASRGDARELGKSRESPVQTKLEQNSETDAAATLGQEEPGDNAAGVKTEAPPLEKHNLRKRLSLTSMSTSASPRSSPSLEGPSSPSLLETPYQAGAPAPVDAHQTQEDRCARSEAADGSPSKSLPTSSADDSGTPATLQERSEPKVERSAEIELLESKIIASEAEKKKAQEGLQKSESQKRKAERDKTKAEQNEAAALAAVKKAEQKTAAALAKAKSVEAAALERVKKAEQKQAEAEAKLYRRTVPKMELSTSMCVLANVRCACHFVLKADCPTAREQFKRDYIAESNKAMGIVPPVPPARPAKRKKDSNKKASDASKDVGAPKSKKKRGIVQDEASASTSGVGKRVPARPGVVNAEAKVEVGSHKSKEKRRIVQDVEQPGAASSSSSGAPSAAPAAMAEKRPEFTLAPLKVDASSSSSSSSSLPRPLTLHSRCLPLSTGEIQHTIQPSQHTWGPLSPPFATTSSNYPPQATKVARVQKGTRISKKTAPSMLTGGNARLRRPPGTMTPRPRTPRPWARFTPEAMRTPEVLSRPEEIVPRSPYIPGRRIGAMTPRPRPSLPPKQATSSSQTRVRKSGPAQAVAKRKRAPPARTQEAPPKRTRSSETTAASSSGGSRKKCVRPSRKRIRAELRGTQFAEGKKVSSGTTYVSWRPTEFCWMVFWSARKKKNGLRFYASNYFKERDGALAAVLKAKEAAIACRNKKVKEGVIIPRGQD